MKKIILAVFPLVCLLGCKNKDAQPEFGFGAQIDGKSWVANVPNSEGSNVAATIAQNIVVIVGVQESGDAKTAFGVFFPEDVKLNEDIDLNPLNKVVVAYTISATEGYLVDPSKGVSGTLRVTKLDKENKIVEGSFSGEAVHTQNGSKIQIKHGVFRSKLYDTSVTTSPPGKK
jgi:hypothetical protein